MNNQISKLLVTTPKNDNQHLRICTDNFFTCGYLRALLVFQGFLLFVLVVFLHGPCKLLEVELVFFLLARRRQLVPGRSSYKKRSIYRGKCNSFLIAWNFLFRFWLAVRALPYSFLFHSPSQAAFPFPLWKKNVLC